MAKLDDDEIESIVGSELTDAISFCDSELSPLRATATDFYFGRPFGDETEGRSQMVSHDVRDTVNQILPSMMRVFCGSDKIVEFEPVGPEDVQNAEQATDYANYILNNDNDGFSIIYSTLKDTLVRKCGIVKAYWDVKEQVKVEKYTGLDDQTLSILVNEPDTKGEVTRTTVEMMQGTDPQTGMPVMMPVNVHDVTVTKTIKKGRVKIEPMPPEELVIARRDKYIGETFAAHRRLMTVSDLVAMGYDEAEVEEHATDEELSSSEELLARSNNTSRENGSSAINDALRKVLYCECYAKIDRDGDGIAESLKICTMGSGFKVVNVEECDLMPFADFPCDPEPHVSSLEAISIADDLIDIQRLKSGIWRNSLDSLAQTINPRLKVLPGANVEDVLNNEVGALLRMKSAEDVQPLMTPDTSVAGIQMIGYVDSVKEARTGMSAAAMGLDADALQSTSRIAASATVSGAQAKQELLARIFANGMKKLFKIILHLTTTNQDQPRMIRLRKKWIPIDPRVWNAEMDVTINVGLGGGTTQEKLQTLSMVAQKQELILQTAGPNNPIVSLAQYSKTLSRMVELAGFKDSDSYFTQLPDDYKAPPQQPQPAPEAQAAALLAQVEHEKTQAKAQADAANIQLKAKEQELKAQQQQFDNAIAAEKMNREYAVKEAQLKLDYAEKEAAFKIKEAELVLKQLQAVQNSQQPSPQQSSDKLGEAINALGQLVASANGPKAIVRDQMGRIAAITPIQPESMQ